MSPSFFSLLLCAAIVLTIGIAGPVAADNTTVTVTTTATPTASPVATTPIPAPVVTSISPASGTTAGGTMVTITGTGFTGATAVTFGTAASVYTIVSDTKITATTPAGSAGATSVAVTTPGGSGTRTYTYAVPIAPPAVSGISPASGTTAGGTLVTITGTGLTGATAVTFGGVPATSFTVFSNTEITATAPAGTSGAVNVVVTTPGGTGTNAYTYTVPVASPQVSTISPASGTSSGGTAVTITGTGFTGATSVTFGAAAATSFTVVSDTEITAIAPPGTAGAVNVVVTTSAGTGTGPYTYSAAPVPVFSGISPASGTTEGDTTVTITGTGFTGATSVFIGGTAATDLTVVSDSEITATTPAGSAGAVNVVVTTPGGVSTGTGVYTYSSASVPVVSGITPSSGTTAGGTTITITGSGFTGATAVTIGGTPAAGFTLVSDTEITATTPVGSAATVDVTVTTAGGISAISTADQFTYGEFLVAGFSASPLSGTVPLTVEFTDTSTNAPTSWIWDFGDGGTSTEENPSHQYSNSGSFPVTLTVTNAEGTNTSVQLTTIDVSAAPVAEATYVPIATATPEPTIPQVSFEGTPTSGSTPLVVHFTATAPGSPESYAWDFGDGGTSTEKEPTYTYVHPGTYTVILTVKYAAGSRPSEKDSYIIVESGSSAGAPLPVSIPLIALGMAGAVSVMMAGRRKE